MNPHEPITQLQQLLTHAQSCFINSPYTILKQIPDTVLFHHHSISLQSIKYPVNVQISSG